MQNSLTWSKLGKSEPAAPGAAAIPRLEQRAPCQAELPAGLGLPWRKENSLSWRGDKSLVPVGNLVSWWGQRGGSSRQSPRAALALGERCQARDWPRWEILAGLGRWHWDVSPPGQGSGVTAQPLGRVPTRPGVTPQPLGRVPTWPGTGGDTSAWLLSPLPCHSPPALLGEPESFPCHAGSANTPRTIPRPGALDGLQENPSIPAWKNLNLTLNFNSQLLHLFEFSSSKVFNSLSPV